MIEIDSSNENEIFEEDKLIVIDFWASWCEPCKAMLPIFEELEVLVDAEKVKLLKIKIDNNRALARKFRVMSVPCVVIMKNGEILEFSTGAVTDSDTILQKINKHLA